VIVLTYSEEEGFLKKKKKKHKNNLQAQQWTTEVPFFLNEKTIASNML